MLQKPLLVIAVFVMVVLTFSMLHGSLCDGVPQDRERIILTGFRCKELAVPFVWTNRIYPDGSAFEYNWPLVESFIEHSDRKCPDLLPEELTVEYWFRKNKVHEHFNNKHVFVPRAGLSRFLSVDEGDDSRKSYKRLHRWRYSPTAAYGNNEVHLHPYKARRLTVAEVLAIQSLPAEFALPDTMTLSDMFKTVGNGVPYLAACGIALAVLQHLRRVHK